jgi:hypothetical protein
MGTAGAAGSGGGSADGAGGAAATGGGSGGAGTAGGTGGGGAGGACLGDGAGAGGAPSHRPASIRCPVTVDGVPARDGGVVSCATDSDCLVDGAATFFHFCVSHQCGVDQCFTDSDCPSGQMCGCASSFRSLTLVRTNLCVSTGCRVDADCASGLCSPNGSDEGYYCHGPADTCRVDADCASCKRPGVPALGFKCQYSTEAGHWQCTPTVPING